MELLLLGILLAVLALLATLLVGTVSIRGRPEKPVLVERENYSKLTGGEHDGGTLSPSWYGQAAAKPLMKALNGQAGNLHVKGWVGASAGALPA